MRPLILDDQAVQALADLKKHAEENPIGEDYLRGVISGKNKPIGENFCHLRIIPKGFHVAFSITETQGVKMRQLSVSVNDDYPNPPRVSPNPKAIAAIAQHLGFTIGDDLEFTEKQAVFPDGRLGFRAPNILEPM